MIGILVDNALIPRFMLILIVFANYSTVQISMHHLVISVAVVDALVDNPTMLFLLVGRQMRMVLMRLRLRMRMVGIALACRMPIIVLIITVMVDISPMVCYVILARWLVLGMMAILTRVVVRVVDRNSVRFVVMTLRVQMKVSFPFVVLVTENLLLVIVSEHIHDLSVMGMAIAINIAGDLILRVRQMVNEVIHIVLSFVVEAMLYTQLTNFFFR